MVTDGDDQPGEESPGDKRTLDLLATLDKRKIDADASSSSSLSKRRRVVSEEPTRAQPTIEIQPNRHDASSLSLSLVEFQRHRGVSEEPIRAEAIREIKPVRRRNRPVRREPVRRRNRPVRREPVRRRNRPVRREPVRREPGETPEWVVELMRKKNGEDVKLIIEKKITATDINKDEGRLLMPVKQIVQNNFLNEAEVNFLEEDSTRARKKGVHAMLMDADGKEWRLNLRIWKMKTSINYVLCSGWKYVVDFHKPKEGHIVPLWSFHSQDGKLYFVIPLKLPPRDIAQPIAQDSSLTLALTLGQPLAQDSSHNLALALAQPIAQDSSQTLALALAIAPASASSSFIATSEVTVTETTMTLDLELRL